MRVRVALALLLSATLSSTIGILGTAPAAAVGAPARIEVAAAGPGYTGIGYQWSWVKGSSGYLLQTSTSKEFSTVTSRTVGQPARPADGYVRATGLGLRQGTRYYARVRALKGDTHSAWSSPVSATTKIASPSSMSSVVAKPGPGAGEITVTWTSAGKNTTAYVLDTALTIFSRTDPALPDVGRHPASYSVTGSKRSITLTARQVGAAGAPVGSGLHLYVRLSARNVGGSAQRTTWSPALLAVAPRAKKVGTGTAARVVTFNVGNAKGSSAHPWERRVTKVASQLVAADPALVGLQEVSPSRVADGRRQTESLLAAVHAAGGGRYAMVRTQPYVPAGTTLGQGTRILYDTSVYKLIMGCPETKADGSWSSACTITLPVLPGEDSTYRRAAAVAHFENRRTGDRVWMVSAHLDPRTSGNHSRDVRFDQLRAEQITKIVTTLAKVNTAKEPVIFTGDINSWQGRSAGSRPNSALYAAGYADAVSTAKPANLKYSTFNGYATTVPVNRLGYNARVDVIMVKNGAGSASYANVVAVTDAARSSDHNLQRADLVLPRR